MTVFIKNAVEEAERVFAAYGIAGFLSVAEVQEMIGDERGSVNLAGAIIQEMQRRMPEARPYEMDELNKIVQAVSELINATPHRYTLGGLSPFDLVQWQRTLADPGIVVPDSFYTEAVVLNDMENYLSVVDAEKPLLTKVRSDLPRKVIYAVNERLQNPDTLDEDIGGHIYRLREEREAPTVHLLNVVARLAGITKVLHNRLFLTKAGQKYRLAPDPFRYKKLLETAVSRLNWGYNCYLERDYQMAIVIQVHAPILLYRLAAHCDLKGIVRIQDFSCQIESICQLELDGAPLERYGWLLNHTILNNLTYFGILKVKEKEPSQYRIERVLSYEPTQHGKTVLRQLVNGEQHGDEDGAGT